MKTPQLPYPELAKALGISDVWLKREDQHHFGSHKGRSISHMIDEYRKLDVTNFVISSSGNAALAAALAIQAHNQNASSEKHCMLTIFVGEHMDERKLKRLKLIDDAGITIEQVENPKQQAFQMDKSGAAKLLRQSTDDLALVGYHQLAEELNHVPNLQAIFIPTSSGTTAQGLGEAFQTLKQRPQIHIVQTEACHPIADAFEESLSYQKRDPSTSIASAIVDHVAYRKEKVVDIIKKSGGSAWIVSDDEIRNAMKLVEDTTEQIISPNSALSVAGLRKAIESGQGGTGAVVCLITGA